MDEETIQAQTETAAGEEGQAPPQEAPPQATEAPEFPEPTITMGEDREPTIPDSFWDDEPTAAEPAKGEGKPGEAAPACYTPQEFAEAFAAGKVDAARLPKGMADYYKVADEALRRQATAPPAQPQPSQPQPQRRMTRETWNQLLDASKLHAARNYLGIDPSELDPDLNQAHALALSAAMQEIQARAAAMGEERRRAQEAQRQIDSLYAEYKSREPEFDEIDARFFPLWMGSLTVREANAIGAIFQSGDMARVRAVLDRVVADYKSRKAGGKGEAQRKAAEPPPAVVKAGGAGEGEGRGMADVSRLGEMSSDELAEFLVKNKFVA
jgi:hypothetical protein